MKIDRLFSIVNILMNKKSVTASYLADYFDVSKRTIYRDIDILCTNGIPIYSSKGKGGGISILDSYYIDKAMFSEDEQEQILMALQSVQVTKQVDVKDSLIKLNNLFKKNSGEWIEIDFSSWEQNDIEKEYFRIIKESISNCNLVSFTYFNNKGEKSNRVVEPLKLIFKGIHWYLYAYCKKRCDFRFFKLTRIENLVKLDDKFERKNIKVKFNDYNTYDKERIEVKLKVDKSLASRVYDEFRNGIIEVDSENFIVTIKMNKSKWIYNYFLGFGESLEIIEPQEVRNEFKKKLKNIINKYL